ncbi:inositol monophosphatase 1-like, partial [Poecilia reticulata]|uniref:inositol monophosphatase 1-like n=1 Tax=Poecilia reticulata TaxID=8081 RepID=UPI0004A416CE
SPRRLSLTLCVSRVRGAGTAAVNLSLVASGCVEAYYEMGMHVWDIAAGSLLVLEAGGVVMDVDGGDADLMSRRIMAANNRSVALQLVQQIAPYRPVRDDAPPAASD